MHNILPMSLRLSHSQHTPKKIFIFISFCVLDVITLIRRDEICVGEIFFTIPYSLKFMICVMMRKYLWKEIAFVRYWQSLDIRIYIIILRHAVWITWKNWDIRYALFFWWIFYDLVWMWKLLWMWNLSTEKFRIFCFI